MTDYHKRAAIDTSNLHPTDRYTPPNEQALWYEVQWYDPHTRSWKVFIRSADLREATDRCAVQRRRKPDARFRIVRCEIASADAKHDDANAKVSAFLRGEKSTSD